MKAISFMGIGRYETVTYHWQGREWQTNLFPEAVARIFEPEKLFVLVTPTAKNYRPPKGEKCGSCGQTLPEPKEDKTYLETLKERLGDLVHPIDIPEGKSRDELWQIFERCAEIVNEGDEILLDITHAFRSIPFIVFAVAAYLRRTKNVTIRHVVYGAYEAREPFRTPPQPTDRAPIFDLTPLLDLLDWLSGAEFLLRRSDATLLAERLKQIHGEAWRERTGDELPKKLQSLGNTLANFSRALHLARPTDVMNFARTLLRILDEVKPEVERWAKPFGVILEQVRAEAAKFAHEMPDRLDAENLRKQLALIEHYLDKGLIMQAVTLAREWVVNWVALQRGCGDWLERNYREEIEKALGGAAAKLRSQQACVPNWFVQLPKSQEVAQLWDWLTDLRNDLAHCGMRKDAAGIGRIEQRAKEIPQKLRSLMDDVPDRAMFGSRVVIDLKSLYGEVAKLDELPTYLERAKELAGEGNEVVLTGQAPIWLYLAVAHALHGKAKRLLYTSPTTGEVLIFDHSSI
ncbi:MAG: TIGR02221 family CRISPR-associated protein [Candidatus Bathyarchaeia archaeon]